MTYLSMVPIWLPAEGYRALGVVYDLQSVGVFSVPKRVNFVAHRQVSHMGGCEVRDTSLRRSRSLTFHAGLFAGYLQVHS